MSKNKKNLISKLRKEYPCITIIDSEYIHGFYHYSDGILKASRDAAIRHDCILCKLGVPKNVR